MKYAIQIFIGVLAAFALIGLVRSGSILSDQAMGNDSPLGAVMVVILVVAGMFIFGRLERLITKKMNTDQS